MSNTAFIEQIAAFVQKYAPQYDIRVHSPAIAQAILESDSGKTFKATFGHNYHGLKYRPNRVPISIGKFTDTSMEDRGEYDEQITDEWFQFANMEDGVHGYFQFINIDNYSNLKGVTDPQTYVENIKADNYATDDDYVEKIMNMIREYDLTKYDPKEGEKKMRINVHAGHNPDGKVACGAIGFLKESTENRIIKNEVIRLLRALGHTVYDCTVDNGTSEKNVLQNNVAKCNAHEVDLDVSIHLNAAAKDYTGNGKTTGVEVFVYKEDSKAKPYAAAVAKAICDLGFTLRDDAVKDGVKIAPQFYVLRNTNAPAMLIECCFVDDKDDVALYDSKKMAEAIVYGITGQRYEEEIVPDIEDDEPGETAAAGGSTSSEFYRVQVGAYSIKANADRMAEKLRAAGFEAIITKA